MSMVWLLGNFPIVNCWETMALARRPTDASHRANICQNCKIFVFKVLLSNKKNFFCCYITNYHVTAIFFNLILRNWFRGALYVIIF